MDHPRTCRSRSHLGFADDHALNAAGWIVDDALYACCREMIRCGKPDGQFK